MGSLSRSLQWPGLGQAETRSWEPQVSHRGGRSPVPGATTAASRGALAGRCSQEAELGVAPSSLLWDMSL